MHGGGLKKDYKEKECNPNLDKKQVADRKFSKTIKPLLRKKLLQSKKLLQ